MAAINELKGMNHLSLSQKLLMSDEDFKGWLVQLGLLHSRRTCDNCGNDMNLNGLKWVCHKRACRNGQSKPKKGYYAETFFEETRLPLKKIFHLSYLWLHQHCTYDQLEFEVGIAREAIAQWVQFFRDICADYFLAKPRLIGGPGIDVEIDETCISKRKYNRGRLARRNEWLYGGVERGTGRSFLTWVQDRSAATLLPILQRYVRPGSNIFSDLWPAYGGIQNLNQNYTHLTVNHSLNFVDPLTGAHTQNIESKWQKFKNKYIKKTYGIHGTANIPDILQEFMWREEFSDRSQIFYNFWAHVAAVYPCEH